MELDPAFAESILESGDELTWRWTVCRIGVPYRNAKDRQFASVLQGIHLVRDRASILLTHAPDHPEIAEAAGVSLQLSGHTHLGQFIPWSWMARRIYRQFVYGLSRIGKMQIFTSSGAETWAGIQSRDCNA